MDALDDGPPGAAGSDDPCQPGVAPRRWRRERRLLGDDLSGASSSRASLQLPAPFCPRLATALAQFPSPRAVCAPRAAVERAHRPRPSATPPAEAPRPPRPSSAPQPAAPLRRGRRQLGAFAARFAVLSSIRRLAKAGADRRRRLEATRAAAEEVLHHAIPELRRLATCLAASGDEGAAVAMGVLTPEALAAAMADWPWLGQQPLPQRDQ